MFSIINAAITPGTHPASVSKKTITTDPQPLSMTDNGGKTIARITRKHDIIKMLKIQVRSQTTNILANIEKIVSHNLKRHPIFGSFFVI
ncbi:hypothetical protein SDC9_58642 [bioreactor metagenome]|uniref:Uncharacterized protein n=1 Tax=bioreactor metagenome TaxID=1076179 RepID=A0A644X7Y4_9ZZZZ